MLVCRKWRDILAGGAAAELWNPIDFRGIGPVKCRARAAQLRYVLNHGPVDVSVSLDDVDPIISGCLHHLADNETRLTLNVHDLYSSSLQARLGRSVFRVLLPMPDVSELSIEGGTFWNGEYPCGNVLPPWAEMLTAEQTNCHWAWPNPSAMKTLTFLWTVSPEHSFNMPWTQIESYAELNTARRNGTVPFSHLANMTNLRVLCLGGVWLPTSRVAVLSLPRLEEFSFVVPWRNVPNDGHFAGIYVPSLRILRLRGQHTRSAGEEDSARDFHSNLEDFLTRCPILTTLSLALHIPYSGSAIVRHMCATPNLQSLYILAANRDMFDLEFVESIADLSITPLLTTLVIQQGRYWDGDLEESNHEHQVSLEFVRAIERRFKNGLKVLSMPETGEGPYAEISTRHERWELAASWDWVDDRWGVGGVKISGVLRENLLALGNSLNVTVDLDSPYQ
ncbi:hypothetical protein R3P38DRAFT_3215422 [Favolaschia claudopus]|uniref:F-box domain-containing protein n=1 Tax=Favolaschia claudopus TaxID=2862362 RepID=A0AAW0A842_9AGAR